MTSLITTELVILDADQGTGVVRCHPRHGHRNRRTGPRELRRRAGDRGDRPRGEDPDGCSRRHRHPARPHRRGHHAELGDGSSATRRSTSAPRTDPPISYFEELPPRTVPGKEHLALLSKLARSLVKKDFVASLRAAATEQEVVDLVETALGLREADTEHAPAGSTAANPGDTRRSVRNCSSVRNRRGPSLRRLSLGRRRPPPRRCCSRACPTGIAHTYMAADALVQAGSEMGIDVVTETQGRARHDPDRPVHHRWRRRRRLRRRCRRPRQGPFRRQTLCAGAGQSRNRRSAGTDPQSPRRGGHPERPQTRRR